MQLPNRIAKFADLFKNNGDDDDILIAVVRSPGMNYTRFHVPVTLNDNARGTGFEYVDGKTVPVQSTIDRTNDVVRNDVSPYALQIADALFASKTVCGEPWSLEYAIKVYTDSIVIRKRMTSRTDEKFERDILRILADFLQLDTSKIVVHVYDNRKQPQVVRRPV